MVCSILIMLDDVVNDFSKTLKNLGVQYNVETDNISERNFVSIFFEDNGDLTEIGKKAFCETNPREDGISLVNKFHKNGAKTVLCTSRDIRLCCDVTKDWLKKNKVNYDYIFTATAPAGLCADMGIPLMIYNLPDKNSEDNIFAVGFKNNNGRIEPYTLNTFKTYGDVEKWITGFVF